MKINFFTPITFENEPKSTREKWIQRIDDYFFLGGKKAVVLNLDQRDLVVTSTFKQKWYVTALKVVSYTTLILPLIGLIAKYSLRKGTSYSEITRNDLRSEDLTLLSNYANSYKQELTEHIKAKTIIEDEELFNKVANIYYNSLLYTAAKTELSRTEQQVRAQTTQVARFAIGSTLKAAANFVASAASETVCQTVGLPALKPVVMLGAKPVADFAVEPVKRLSHQAVSDLTEDNSTLRDIAWRSTLETTKETLSHDSKKLKLAAFLKANYIHPCFKNKYKIIKEFKESPSLLYKNFFYNEMNHQLAYVLTPFISDLRPETLFKELVQNKIETLPDLDRVKTEFDQEDLTYVYFSSVGAAVNTPKRLSQAFSSAASSAWGYLVPT